jgi:nitroreductase
MMTVKEAMENRRSIRKYKLDPVPGEFIKQILESARLAPSGVNRQPWRFRVVTDPETKAKLREAAFNQKFVEQAPVVIVCCSDLLTFVKDTKKRLQELVDAGAIPPAALEGYPQPDYTEDWGVLKQFIPEAMFNTSIAIEHMILTATALGLGSCWIARIRGSVIQKILGLDKHIILNALLTIGYSDEYPSARPRLPLQDILI